MIVSDRNKKMENIPHFQVQKLVRQFPKARLTITPDPEMTSRPSCLREYELIELTASVVEQATFIVAAGHGCSQWALHKSPEWLQQCDLSAS